MEEKPKMKYKNIHQREESIRNGRRKTKKEQTRRNEIKYKKKNTQATISKRSKKRYAGLPNSTEETPAWKAYTRPAIREYPRILQILMVHYSGHKNLSLDSILNQTNLIQVLPLYFLKIRYNTTSPSTPRSSQWPLSLRCTCHYLIQFFAYLTVDTSLFSHSLSLVSHLFPRLSFFVIISPFYNLHRRQRTSAQ